MTEREVPEIVLGPSTPLDEWWEEPFEPPRDVSASRLVNGEWETHMITVSISRRKVAENNLWCLEQGYPKTIIPWSRVEQAVQLRASRQSCIGRLAIGFLGRFNHHLQPNGT